MFAEDLTVIIPGRNEEWMRHTVEDVVSKSRADTEVIAVCDASWPAPPLVDHPAVKILHTTDPIGQRAATNLGAELSRARYIMKLDAHCSVDEGFDVKLIDKMEPDWTMVPMMHRLHAFDWACNECGEREYQGVRPEKCKECGCTEMYHHVVWEPRWNKQATVSWRFDRTLHFQYWRKHRKRPEVRKQAKENKIIETMSCIGCCFLMERERFWELGGMDEGHGSWGQYGTELACKAWLSGGKLVTNLTTWIAHMFRTGNFAKGGQSSWPYPINQRQIDAARKYSRELWLEDKWPLATRRLEWLINHFKPIPDWHDAP